MEEYKPNSHAYKEEQKTADSPVPKKKFEKVVTGTVKTKKKSEAHKLLDIFLPEDITSVKSYILYDILVPAVKRFVSDSVDAILYPGGDGPRRKTAASKVSYASYYGRDRDRRVDPPSRVKNGFDYDDIIFESRGDAEAVLSAMMDAINQYNMVSVADLYDIAEVSTTNYAANRYGWTDIRDISNAEPVRLRDGGYILKLPRAMPLN